MKFFILATQHFFEKKIFFCDNLSWKLVEKYVHLLIEQKKVLQQRGTVSPDRPSK
jgi:predicted transcriptional regulator